MSEKVKTPDVASEPKTDFKVTAKKIGKGIRDNKTSVVKYGAFLFIIVLFIILTGGKLFTARTVNMILRSALPLIVIACGAAMVYSNGESDLACGGVTGFAAVFGIWAYNGMSGAPFGVRALVVFLITIAIGTVVYFVIWYVCQKFKLNSMFASMSLMFILRGIGGAIVDASYNESIQNYDIAMLDTKNYIKIFYSNSLVPIIITVIVVLVTGIMLGYTTLGKRNKSLADNPLSSMQSGTKPKKTKMIFYLIAGACIGIGAALYMGYNPTPSTDPSGYGKEYMMEALIAMILGGMPVSGGAKSKISSVVIGAFTLKILYYGLTIWIPQSFLNGVITAQVAYQLFEGIIFLVLVEMIIRQPKYIRALP
jgi:ribose transport system permease protein